MKPEGRRKGDRPTRAPHGHGIAKLRASAVAESDRTPTPAATKTDRRARRVRAYDDDALCFARMKRDYAAAERIIARRRARNEFIATQVKRNEAIAANPEFAALLGCEPEATLALERVTMSTQQYFIALACRYATNEQLATFLWVRADDTTLNRLHAAFHKLREISDEDWAWMDLRARPHGVRWKRLSSTER